MIEDSIAQLRLRLGDDTSPLLIEAYRHGPHITDTLATIRKTRFASAFAACRRVDLVDLVERDCLNEAAASLRQCRLALSTSYHVTLFLKTLGVPVYFLAVNEYYRQKKQGLGDALITLDDFLAGVDRVNDSGEAYAGEQSAIRSRWFAQVDATLATPPHDARLLQRATAALQHMRWQRNNPTSSPPVPAPPTALHRLTAWVRRQRRKLLRR
jgi:hypothetical protein